MLFRAFILVLCLLGCGGCCGPVAGLYPPPEGEATRKIYIYNNNWHTGFVLNTHELSPRAQQVLGRFADYPWVEIGWGDRDFYRAPKGTTALALQAVFCSHGSVIHIVGVEPDPMAFYRSYVVDLYRIRISQEGYRRLEDYILGAFQRDDQGEVTEMEPGLYRYSRFYAGRGHYFLLHTCNNWTAEGLRETGFPITPCWAQFANNLGSQIKSNGPKYQADIVARKRD